MYFEKFVYREVSPAAFPLGGRISFDECRKTRFVDEEDGTMKYGEEWARQEGAADGFSPRLCFDS